MKGNTNGSGNRGKKRPSSVVKKSKDTFKANSTNHTRFKGWYVTPNGKFSTATEAAASHDFTSTTIYRRCKDNSKWPEWNFLPKE